MNPQMMNPQEPQLMDLKAELKRHEISLHNTKLNVQILEFMVEKFKELIKQAK